MARLFGMETVAEGTETAEVVSYLGRNGCDQIQGFFISPAIPAKEFEKLFLTTNKSLEVAEIFSQEEGRTLLLLDDEENILRSLQRVLRSQGWKILTTTDPDEAFALLARHKVQVVVSDQRMPRMSGTEFLNRIKELHPHIVRIILSGYTDLNSVTEAVNRGWVYKFLTKPWDDTMLVTELKEAFEQYDRSTMSCSKGIENMRLVS